MNAISPMMDTKYVLYNLYLGEIIAIEIKNNYSKILTG